MLFEWITIKWMVFLVWLSLGALNIGLHIRSVRWLEQRIESLKSTVISDNHVLAGKLDNVLANQKKIADAINSK